MRKAKLKISWESAPFGAVERVPAETAGSTTPKKDSPGRDG
jgi:hypothetical protein